MTTIPDDYNGIISLKNKPIFEGNVLTILGDAVFEPTIEKIRNIINDFCGNNKKDIIGYFENGNLQGIICIEIKDKTEIKYIGVHKSNRNKGIGSRLIDYIRKKVNHDIYAETDDDAIQFYSKYGFECESFVKFYKYKEIKRYKCTKLREES